MNLLKYTKKEITEMGIVDAQEVIEEGKEDILQAYLVAMAQVEYFKAVASALHREALIDFEKYGEKTIDLQGRKITSGEVGVKYDFSNCGHIVLESLERERKEADEIIKGLKDQIKNIRKPQMMLDETGEVFEVKPPVKISSTKLKLTY